MKRTFILLVILFLAAISSDARGGAPKPVELTLHPAKAPEPRDKYRLLPKPDQQRDCDALPLYKKAVQSLPKNYERDEISRWDRVPLKDLPIEQVKSTLQKLGPTLELVKQAGLCKQCKWPATEDLSKYRQFAYILALEARVQIAEGQYDQAISTMQTGFAMARHLGEAPILVRRIVGVAIGGLMCRELEQFVQAPGSPNLYWTLQSLPKPLIDLSKQIEGQPTATRDRVHLLMKKLDRQVASLQCIEALRLYAAAHNGKFPNELSDVTEVSIPDDPVTQKAFVYRRSGSKAVLEALAPKGARPEDAMQYKLTLKGKE